MKSAIVHLVGESPYSQSKHYTEDDEPICGIDPKKKTKELHDAYEQRTWRHRMHVLRPDEFVVMPPSSFSNGIKGAAKRLKLQVPGMGRVEYTKYFDGGIMVTEGIVLPVKAKDVVADKLFVPSDGRPGGGKRVIKYFPRIDAWQGKVTFFVFDDIITEDVFTRVLRAFGQIVGVGRFRPENRGFYGRFSVKAVQWLEEDATMDLIGKAA